MGVSLMREINLRTWHRRTGIILALFIILQAGSGFLITLGDLTPSKSPATEPAVAATTVDDEEHFWDETLGFIHFGAGAVGVFYRILLGAGILWMAVSGGLIFFRIRARSKK
jgi:hypothetical protein